MNIYVVTMVVGCEVEYFIFRDEKYFNIFKEELDCDNIPDEEIVIAKNLRNFHTLTRSANIVDEVICDVVEGELIEVS